jgi:hypothetical protein
VRERREYNGRNKAAPSNNLNSVLSSLAGTDSLFQIEAQECFVYITRGDLSKARDLALSIWPKISIEDDSFLKTVFLTVIILSKSFLGGAKECQEWEETHIHSISSLSLEFRGVFLGTLCLLHIQQKDYQNALVFFKGLSLCVDMMQVFQILPMQVIRLVD